MSDDILSRTLNDGFEAKTYKDARLPIEGLGPQHLPFIDMEPFLPTYLFSSLQDEVNLALASIPNYGYPNVSGTIPEELREFQTETHPLDMLYNIERYDPTGQHREMLAQLPEKEQKVKYCTFALGAAQVWYFSVFLLQNEYLDRQDPSKMERGIYADLFPKTIDFVQNRLPFKYVSRAILFSTFPGAEVRCHRDYVNTNHTDHHICFNFGPGRRAYVYDCMEQRKIFAPRNGRAYMFNDRDYHGVAPVPYFTYTIRVDGQFEDWLCDALQFEGGKASGY